MPPVPSPVLKLAVLQFAPCLRDPAANLEHIVEAAGSTPADILLTPELATTGYDLGDDAPHLAVAVEAGQPIRLAGADTGRVHPDSRIVYGLVEKGENGHVYNTAAVVQDGVVRYRHRKVYLPTYGMFDEARFFARGCDLEPWDAGGGWRFGVLICEDFWHPGLIYALAASGVHGLLVLAAAPGRGVWDGGEAGGLFASADVWERIARTTAQLYGIYVALGNRVGVEGGVTFAGGSLIVNPAGEVIARAGEMGDAVLVADLSREEIDRTRRPYAHARDDDPGLVRRLLERLA